MPELPEVHGYQQFIDKTSLNQKIVSFDCRDHRLLKKSFLDFEKILLGNSLIETERIGKYLFIKTSGNMVLVLHFGMTGRPSYYKDEEQRPKFAHIVLTFDSGFHFGFENKRKFGWWDFTESIEQFKNERGLSNDARSLSLKDFKENLSNRKTDIKKVLLDQSVAAGVGNWMADEILYQAKVHPKQQVDTMAENTVESIYHAMQKVIEVAIEKQAHYESFPEDFLMHFRKEDGICHHTGDKIQKLKVGGRTTYFSPSWQKP